MGILRKTGGFVMTTDLVVFFQFFLNMVKLQGAYL